MQNVENKYSELYHSSTATIFMTNKIEASGYIDSNIWPLAKMSDFGKLFPIISFYVDINCVIILFN